MGHAPSLARSRPKLALSKRKDGHIGSTFVTLDVVDRLSGDEWERESSGPSEAD
jgi:hypothetical protein